MSKIHCCVWRVAASTILGGMICWAAGLVAFAQGAEAASGPAADGLERSVTVYPIVITPSSPNFKGEFAGKVAEVVGMLLERAGLGDVELAKATFVPSDGETAAQIADRFGAAVREASIDADYAVFGQFVGTPKSGVQEIRTIVVDKDGKAVLVDRADKKALARSKIKPDCPLTCCVFLVGRIQEHWGLNDPLRNNPPSGKLNQRWRQKTGLPSSDEVAEIKARLQTMKKSLKASRLAVYPVRTGAGTDRPCAGELADMLADCGARATEVSELDLRLDVAGDSNEQKVLWDAARAFRQFLRKNPPATDYAVYADYGMWSAKGETGVGYVHFIVCDRKGDWVIVDYQNSHHRDFVEIDPKSKKDCNRLVLKRLKGIAALP
ncbi:MAG: hypothetical protein ACYTG0_25310 [Planctomycetota bacterium]|jgi:nucleotide-binding universal stress UspA family protein